MGGSGNIIAVQAAPDIGETEMAYALVVDSIDYSIRVMFLLRAINPAPLLMALTGYVIGTGGGIITARIMGMFA